ncbi:hypothetical protein AB0H58_12770 [Nocardia neocaledoniensis]|uniref:hypothetical protein n=1 Tax=Nocardia neocaledoniensis TaxID=236511 RepID=UPI0033FCDFC2
MHQRSAQRAHFVAQLVGIAEALPQGVRRRLEAVGQFAEFTAGSPWDGGEVGQQLVRDPRRQLGVEAVFGQQSPGVPGSAGR